MLYVGMSRAAIDERGFEAVRRIRQSNAGMPLSVFKAMVREQFNILLIDTEAALEAIPSMLPPEAKTRLHALHLVETALSARGEMSVEYKKENGSRCGPLQHRQARAYETTSPRHKSAMSRN